MSTVTPFLIFNDQLEVGIAFYTSTVPDSRLVTVARAGQDGPISSAEFIVGGRHFLSYNGDRLAWQIVPK